MASLLRNNRDNLMIKRYFLSIAVSDILFHAVHSYLAHCIGTQNQEIPEYFLYYIIFNKGYLYYILSNGNSSFVQIGCNTFFILPCWISSAN